ncbi:unnamed protein product [Paramecium pentaurelia]|uniref:Transmembrane protein n=1 Tax=Paramecium pentaurelia TaxID=43138 RepID=A0A8S1YE47_9CILI|nr:unnamed protein product [Paramecium pentaurelia]
MNQTIYQFKVDKKHRKSQKEVMNYEVLCVQIQLYTKSTIILMLIDQINQIKEPFSINNSIKYFFIIGYVSLQILYQYVAVSIIIKQDQRRIFSILQLEAICFINGIFYELNRKQPYNKVYMALFTDNLDYET